jgi:hypothetical protein
MLKTVEMSRAKKTAGIAVTYRAGKGDMFGTCPASCNLNDSGDGAENVDNEYLDALLNAKPKKGFSFTYSHFHFNLWIDKARAIAKTVINYSADSLADAINSFVLNVPTVTVVPESKWNGSKYFHVQRSDIPASTVQVIRCPAEYRNISCNDCGNGEPLCARMDRNYIIGFTAHGPNKRKAASKTEQGGCYAAQGNCRIWWTDTAASEQPDETDGKKLLRFVKSLPVRAIVRHHVAGDIGAD